MKWLIIIKLTFLFISNVLGQNNSISHLLELEEKIFFAENDSVKNNLCLRKFNYSLANNLEKEKLLFELNRVQESLIMDSISLINYLWNASIVTKLNGSYSYSNMYFDAYLNKTRDTSNNVKVLGLLIKSEIDSSTYADFYSIYVKDSSFKCMQCLNDLNSYILPHKKAYVLASTIFPGLGTMLTGDFYNGFGSLILVPSSVFGVINLWRGGLYYNAVSWGIALIPRLYFGNTSLTSEKVNQLEKLKLKKLSDKCNNLYKSKLLLFPVNYKF